MKNNPYFSHDYNARADRKLVKLQAKLNMEGIGIFWCIIEMLYEEAGYLPKEYDSIAFELRANNSTIKSVIEDFDLFEFDDEKFWSESCLERINKRMEISKIARENINKRWDKYKRNTGVIPKLYKPDTLKERKGKEREGKENKGKEREGKESKEGKIIYPLLEEVILYFQKNGFPESLAKRAFEYYSVADWKDSKGNQVRNWKQKMQAVWFKEENKFKINGTTHKEKADPNIPIAKGGYNYD